MHQSVELIGRVGKNIITHEGSPADKEKGTKKKVGVTTFTMATAEYWTSGDGEKKERSTWHSIIAYGHQSKICEKWVVTGMLVWVKGKIQKSKFTDKSGVDRMNVQVAMEKVLFLNKPQEKPHEKCPYCGETLKEDDLFDGEVYDNAPLGVGAKGKYEK